MNLTRLSGAVDIDLMASANIWGVGTGGAVNLYEDLVRSGLGHLTVIDFDKVDETNLTTQGYEPIDVGLPKVDSLGRRLKSINPNLDYRGINTDFLDIPEPDISKFAESTDLLLMMTDNFRAQARGNLVALKYKTPTMFAIVYERARCSEITFVVPGLTPACHRCAVSARYKAYEEGYENNVRQESSTVFHTHYLNSCLGLLALAILHRNTTGLEFSNWFGDRWERSLLQIRMHPSYGDWDNSVFKRTFQGSPRVFNFDSVWQLIEPEYPPKYVACPDCGGSGDLTAINTITDTTPRLRTRR